MFQTHLFLQRFIKNRTRMTHRRIDEVVQLRYNDISSIEKIIEKIRIILKNNKYVDPNFTPYVFFDTYADYYLKIIIQVYTTLIDFKEFMQLKQDILLEIKNVLDEYGAEMAFPTTTVELNK